MTSTIGQPVARIEGREKLSGRARYTGDYRVPGMLYGAILRSPYPHARLLHVDTSRALQAPGVRAVISGQDIGERLYGRAVADVRVLAVDRVRYVGEPVAAVAADTPEAAEEALGLIEAEYEELPAVFDPFAAMEADAPIIHARAREYARGIFPGGVEVVPTEELPDVPNLCAYELRTWGDVEQGFRDADLVFEHRYRTPSQHQGYLEPHSCIVEAQTDGGAHIWASNKAPFTLRSNLARDLRLPEESILLEPMLVGGDFGGKGSPMLMPLAYFLSQAARAPVRLVLSWREEFQAANPRHPAWITIKSGVNRDGALVAREVQAVYASGAYAGFKPVAHARLGTALRQAAGVYRIPHFKFEMKIVYTNHVPMGHMRGPGGAQIAFAEESEMDRLAEALGMDPIEFRLRNAVEEGDPSPLGYPWRSVRAKECLQAVKDASGWEAPKAANVGRGVATTEEGAGGGGSSSIVEVHPDGTATLVTSVNDQGSGSHTMLTQVVAHELQLPLDRVRLQFTGTDGPWDRGSSAASVTRSAGTATIGAAGEARDKLAAVAAEYLGCPPEQVELVDGQFRDRERPASAMAFADVAARACRDGEPVTGFHRYEAWNFSAATSFVAQVAEVEVDPETGQVRVRRVVSASDVGTVLNPIGVTGQLEGASIMGLGFAVTEELPIVDGRVEALGHHEYKLPTIADIPAFENLLITTGEGEGPYGAKGVGELSHLTMPAAIANAVADAVGTRITELPITAERVHDALHRIPPEDPRAAIDAWRQYRRERNLSSDPDQTIREMIDEGRP
jgi:carbon-monoxide dehydrogenase large subunit